VARAGLRRALFCGASGLCLALIALPVASTPARAELSGGGGGTAFYLVTNATLNNLGAVAVGNGGTGGYAGFRASTSAIGDVP